MNKGIFQIFLGVCWVLSLTLFSVIVAAQPKVGDRVANLKFNKPITGEDMKYLGLTKMGPFRLNDIKSQYILVDVFSTT